MAKHTGKRRKFRKYLRGKIDIENALSTLGANTLISASVAGSVVERTWVSSIECTWALADLPVTADDGPVTVGVAHSDYSDAEIEAYIENTGSWQETDLISQEIAKRKIRIVGTFSNEGVAAEAAQTAVLNDGKPIKTKCNWVIITGQNLKMWAYNTGASALGAGSSVHTMGHANLWPST